MKVVEMKKCAVCNWDIKEEAINMKLEGKDLVVCCDECRLLVADKQQIIKHIHGLFEAFLRKDVVAIRRGHTEDWKGFQVGSRHLVRGVDQYMESAQQAMQRFNGTRYEILDLDVQVHGDLAVAFYLATYWFKNPGEKGEQTIGLRSADIYRREAQGWNQSGSNISIVPEAI